MPKVNPEALRALIFAMGYSIAGFAMEIEMAPSHLSNVLAGRRGVSAGKVKRMAEVLKVPTAALLLAPSADVAS